ncbi:hypothetical protein Tco_1411988, partial [Tanacetum coccineum]
IILKVIGVDFCTNLHGVKELIHGNRQNQQVRLLMLLLAAKGLLLAVYSGRMVERDNFSPQQPPQTHRQERLTNKRWLSLLPWLAYSQNILNSQKKARQSASWRVFPLTTVASQMVMFLAWELTKVATMADVFCFSDGLPL